MALMDFIKKQFIDILQWTEDADGTLAWRFPMADLEIQNGASLTVRESQLAIFVNEGKVADVRTGVLYEKSHSVVKCDYIWKRTDLWINFPWSDQDPVAKRDWSVKDA